MSHDFEIVFRIMASQNSYVQYSKNHSALLSLGVSVTQRTELAPYRRLSFSFGIKGIRVYVPYTNGKKR